MIDDPFRVIAPTRNITPRYPTVEAAAALARAWRERGEEAYIEEYAGDGQWRRIELGIEAA